MQFKRVKIRFATIGDIFSAEDFAKVQERFSSVIVYDGTRCTGVAFFLQERSEAERLTDKEEIRKFHDIVYHTYCQEVSGDRNVLFKMKELWFICTDVY